MGRKIKTAIVIVGPRLYLIVSDVMSGKRNRFTTHQVSLVGMKRTRVVGRELTKAQSEKLIRRLEGSTHAR